MPDIMTGPDGKTCRDCGDCLEYDYDENSGCATGYCSLTGEDVDRRRPACERFDDGSE